MENDILGRDPWAELARDLHLTKNLNICASVFTKKKDSCAELARDLAMFVHFRVK